MSRQRRRRHVGLHADRHRQARAIDPPQRFGERDRIGVIEPLSAIGHGLGQAEATELGELAENLVRRKNLRLLPGIDVRIDFRIDEALDARLQFAVLGAEQHALSHRISAPAY